MLRDLATTHAKVKLSLIRSFSACLLLCGVVITGQLRGQQTVDGPISVSVGSASEKCNIKVDSIDLTKLPALPRGYSALPSMAYRITSKASAVGPYAVTFGVPSINDEAAFNKLRVFHAEPDEFDPDSSAWVDRTGAEADASAPNFADRTIKAYSDRLESGIYVIAKVTEKFSQTTAMANLEVVASPPPRVVQMPAYITTSVIVKNNGPAPATDVGLKQQVARGRVVSMKSSQGTCKWKQVPGWVYCKLGPLAAGSFATIAVEIDPSPEFAGQYRSFVEVAAKEIDRNTDDNWAVATADTLADANSPPEVTLESPETEQLFEQGATVIFNATATDSDGSITKVEFFDFGKSLGIASSTDANHFSLSSNQLENGRHILSAIATDNGGRQKESNARHIFVNGPIKVRIVKQKTDSQLAAGSEVTLTAIATNPVGSIRKVEFFYNGGFLLGEATAKGDNQYSIVLRGLAKTNYAIEAIATDGTGLVSKSATLRFKVMK